MREKSWRSVNIKKKMLKTIIRKLEKKKKKTLKLERLQRFVLFFCFFSSSFKLKRLTQNPKAELKRFWVGLDCETK